MLSNLKQPRVVPWVLSHGTFLILARSPSTRAGHGSPLLVQSAPGQFPGTRGNFCLPRTSPQGSVSANPQIRDDARVVPSAGEKGTGAERLQESHTHLSFPLQEGERESSGWCPLLNRKTSVGIFSRQEKESDTTELPDHCEVLVDSGWRRRQEKRREWQ